MKFNQINIMPLKEQQIHIDRWKEERLNSLLPKLMEEHDFDMWIIVCREDQQDPVLSGLLPRGLTGDENVVMPPVGNQIIIVFYRSPSGKMEKLLISMLRLKDFYENIWDEKKESEWECLARVVKDRNPQRIGVNSSELFAHADGLTFTQHQKLLHALGSFANRIESAEKLVLSWLQERTEEELIFYPQIAEIGHAIYSKAFSNEVIIPGKTSVTDLCWWMHQCVRDLGLSVWFKPMVAINRQGQEFMEFNGIIQRGDMLFCDFGLNYLGLMTDTQRQAYVLKVNESDVPPGLKTAMKTCNQLQDIFFEEFKVGKSGNEILFSILNKAKEEHIDALINAHPIGVYGHGPGAPIGVWNQQNGIPGRGDYPIRDNSCYAMELCANVLIPEWDMQRVAFHLEQTVAMKNSNLECLDQRQTEFYLIG